MADLSLGLSLGHSLPTEPLGRVLLRLSHAHVAELLSASSSLHALHALHTLHALHHVVHVHASHHWVVHFVHHWVHSHVHLAHLPHLVHLVHHHHWVWPLHEWRHAEWHVHSHSWVHASEVLHLPGSESSQHLLEHVAREFLEGVLYKGKSEILAKFAFGINYLNFFE